MKAGTRTIRHLCFPFAAKQLASAGILIILALFGLYTVLFAADEKEFAGRTLYAQYCSSCHGIHLQGGNAQSLVDKIWQFGEGRGYVAQSIKYGLPHLGMPGYEKTLSDSQINQLIDYLFEAEKNYGAVKPPIPKQLQTMDYNIRVEVFADGLQVPWSIAFIDKDRALVTERPGRLRLVADGKLQTDPIADTPKVLNEGQGGLLDVAIDPDYESNGWIYLSYSHVLEGDQVQRPPAMTRLVRGRIKDNTWTDQQVIYEAPHESYLTTRHHYGCRLDQVGLRYLGSRLRRSFGQGSYRSYDWQHQDLSCLGEHRHEEPEHR